MEEFNTDEITLMLKFGITVPRPQASKVIRVNLTCKLCQTVITQFFQMIQQPNGAWIKNKEISPVTDKVEVSNILVSICSNCKEVLMQKEKAELIEMLLDFYSFNAPNASRNEVQNKDYKIRRKSNERDCTGLV